MCTRLHSLSNLPASLCLSNRSFFVGLSFSNKNPPQLTLVTIMCPFTKKIAVCSVSGLQTLLVFLLRLSVAEVSLPEKLARTHFFLRLWFSPL